ncbi:MAG: protein O-mannosyl-transferase family [Chloroflexota bacterium]
MRTEQKSQDRQLAIGATWSMVMAALVVFLCSDIFMLALTRLLYEWQFPNWLWLGRPATALSLSVVAAFVAALLWWRGPGRERLRTALIFPPLLLNLPTIVQPDIPPLHSRLLFAAGLWLSALFAHGLWARRRRAWHYLIFLTLALLPIYLLTMGRTVGRADTFEFQVVIPQLGIAHPTGYPLYLLLGKLFTFVPFGSVAWRVNLASAFFALAAAAFLFLLARRLLRDDLAALLAAVLMGLLPTFWSQAIEAEVYTLHALIVLAALYLMVRLLDETDATRLRTQLLLLAFLVGLGLTNHLTTIILLPAALLTVALTIRQSPISNLRSLIPTLLLAFLLPLLLYVYLPLRWAAVNGEPMGLGRFVDWVIGGRFQGALNLWAWLEDPSRYAVVGRLLSAEWQPGWLLGFSLVGLIYLLARRRRVAAILLLTAAGYAYYGLSYYVPDLSVFILPLHLILALLWGLGIGVATSALIALTNRVTRNGDVSKLLLAACLAVPLSAVIVLSAARTWPSLDRSQADGGGEWARGVLQMPLPPGAAILADSEKFPPLYYLQQAEGVRPDLDIIVAPDEAAYRSELAGRLAQGQQVYLARFIPGLEGQYHLRSQGPLVQVATSPLASLPESSRREPVSFGPLKLLGYELAPVAAVDRNASALTLYWQIEQEVEEAFYVYTRWRGEGYVGRPIPAAGQHPAGNYYPTVAWQPGEIVPDYHLLPRPLVNESQTLTVEVALGAPFSRPEELSWQAVAQVPVEPATELGSGTPAHLQLGPALIEATQFPGQVRPGSEVTLLLSGCGNDFEALQFELAPGEMLDSAVTPLAELEAQPACRDRQVRRFQIETPHDLDAGRYALQGKHPDAQARCRWLAAPSAACSLGSIDVQGVALPEGASNYDDMIALLEADVAEANLQAGGQLAVTLTWQALAPIDENYTVFVQVVDAQNQIVGQVDSWPLQGTYPTSQWRAGEVIEDGYQIQLPAELPPGRYRLLIGWYQLSTQQRLPVLDESGAAIDDKVVIPGLTVQ